MKKNLILSLIIFSFSLVSQNETNYWPLGMNSGLDFSAGTPTVWPSHVFSHEPMTSASDPITGNLLFYSDGLTVYNDDPATSFIMPNGTGLLSDSSSTMGALAVPQPGNPGIYYLFTVNGGAESDHPAGPQTSAFYYNVIDMNANSGKGAVIQKNILVELLVGEQLSAVLHANCTDYWITVKKAGDWTVGGTYSNAYYTYLLTSTGLSAPVISTIGLGVADWVLGYAKFSPDGNKYATAILQWSPSFFLEDSNSVQLFDFNKNTGVFTNPLTLKYGEKICRNYGLSFSSDNSKLYAYGDITNPTSGDFHTQKSMLSQWDLTVNNPLTILASETIVLIDTTWSLKTISLAKNGKIYISDSRQGTNMNVINNPNNAGIACSINTTTIGLSTGLNFINSFSHPNFPANYLNQAGSCSPVISTPTPTFYASGTNQNCIDYFSGSLTAYPVNLPAPVTYDWQPWGLGDIHLTGIGPGIYTVTATDGNSATYSATVEILSYVPPTPIASSYTLDCTNLTSTLTAIANSTLNTGTIVWNGGALVNASNPAVVSAPGIYTVTVDNFEFSCNYTETVSITSNVITPTISAITNSINCTISTATLTANSLSNTIIWNGGTLVNATNPATVSVAGNYTATTTNTLNGCSTTTVVTVLSSGSGMPSVSIVTPLQITCSAPTITLTGNSITPGVTYSWSAGATTATQTVNAIGNYTLTVTNTLTGCSSATVVAVSSNTTLPIITSAINSGSITCTILTSTLTGTSAGNTMFWNGGSLTNATNPATVTAAGNYTLTATNATNGCTSTSVVAVSSNTTLPIITSAINSGSITCTTLTSTLTGTSAGNTMVWNGGSLSNATNPAIVTAASNYTVTATNATNGCSVIATTSVTAIGGLPSVSVVTPLQITCSAPTVTLTGSSITPGVTYSWSAGATTATQTVNAIGNYTLTVTNTLTGCSSATLVAVSSNTTFPVITLAINSGSITCTTLTSTLTGTSAGNTMVWNGGSLTNSTNPATVTAAGNYTLTATNATNGCTSNSVVAVSSNTTLPIITSAINSGSITCTSLTSTLTGTSAGNTMVWNGGSLTNATNPATVTAAGNYTLTATNATNGCSSSSVVAVSGSTVLSISFSATPISGNAPLLVTCTNLSTGATSYTWDFSDNTNNTSNLTNENHTYANTGDYIITLNGIFGLCSGTSTVLIHVIDDSPLIIPNVFSPNNDGVNDAWEFKLKKASNCQLYDRWGLKLFETNTSTIKWEGRTSSGMPCVEGTYFYIINTYDSNDKAISLQGFVNLFR